MIARAAAFGLVLTGACSLYAPNTPADAPAPHADAAGPGADAPASTDAKLATITFTGTIYEISSTGYTFSPDANVELLELHGGARLAGTVSQSTGAYGFTVATGGAPIDGYLHVSKPGFPDTYLFPAAPFTPDDGAYDAYLVAAADYPHSGGAATQDPSLALFHVYAIGGNAPIAGATITISPRGASQTSYPDPDPNHPGTFLSSTGSNGLGIIANVPLGAIWIDGSPSLRGHWIDAHAGAVSIVYLSP